MTHVIDGAIPLLRPDTVRDHLADLRRGGLTGVAPTVASLEPCAEALDAVRGWHALAAADPETLRICTAPGDLAAAREAGVLGVVLHFQGGDPLEGSIENLRTFAEAGVRVVQPTYNAANLLGGGAFADPALGLTAFGREAVAAMGELGVVCDVSHANERTALDALDCATGPVLASHSNARARYDHPRNISDTVIRGIADRGGVIGICGFPGFLGPTGHVPTADDLLDHAAHIVDLVGPDAVSIGLDLADEDEGDYAYFGYDPAYYPPPPWTYPAGIAGFADFAGFAERARQRGWDDGLVAGLMGDNYARVVGTVA
ncbi:dipeptidase [Pimelobacter simplex]|uniref:dipeptidase n=1 Tax=Nocardioides simplex TaxID=2045 RepID=UPI00366E61E9